MAPRKIQAALNPMQNHQGSSFLTSIFIFSRPIHDFPAPLCTGAGLAVRKLALNLIIAPCMPITFAEIDQEEIRAFQISDSQNLIETQPKIIGPQPMKLIIAKNGGSTKY